MDAFERIGFYLSQAIRSAKWHIRKKLFPEAHKKRWQMFEELDSEQVSRIEEEVKNDFEEHERQRPVLDPRRTMAFVSRPEEHGCNFLSAAHYRRQIYCALAWAKKHGFTCFIADYSTPYGLLALETILQLKQDGIDITIYAAKSRWIKARKTYRLIKEPPLELAMLTASADYCFLSLPLGTLIEVFSNSGVLCSEEGLWISKKKIPAYVLRAWKL